MRATDLLAALRRRGVEDVSDSTLDRALYSSDASLYRVVPQAVVRPRSGDELVGAVSVARSLGVPVTMRTTHGGAGPVAVAAQLDRFRTRLSTDRTRVQEA